MGRGIQVMNKKSTYEKTPKDLSILFVSGEFDPQAGVRHKAMYTVYNGYVKAGLKDVSVKIYPGARHEAHNEPGKVELYRDVAEFILKRT